MYVYPRHTYNIVSYATIWNLWCPPSPRTCLDELEATYSNVKVVYQNSLERGNKHVFMYEFQMEEDTIVKLCAILESKGFEVSPYKGRQLL